jgi:hypothetical protein
VTFEPGLRRSKCERPEKHGDDDRAGYRAIRSRRGVVVPLADGESADTIVAVAA